MPYTLPRPLQISRILLYIFAVFAAAFLLFFFTNLLIQPTAPDLKNIEIDQQDNLYISDTTSHSLIKYNLHGERLAAFGGKGYDDGQYNSDLDLRGSAITQQGFVYIVDNKKAVLNKYDPGGKFLNDFSIQEIPAEHNDYPVKVAVDSQGRIYIATDKVGVKIYNDAGKFLGILGADLAGKNKINGAEDITVDSQNNVFVGANSEQIFKFDSNGHLITSWSIKNFFKPVDKYYDTLSNLDVDSQGNVYVDDQNVVEKFDPTGKFLLSWQINTGGEYLRITGITTDSKDHIIILNNQEKRVEIYNPQGQLINQWSVGFPYVFSLNRPYSPLLVWLLIPFGPLIGLFERRAYKKYGVKIKFNDLKPDFPPSTNRFEKLARRFGFIGAVGGILFSFFGLLFFYSTGTIINSPVLGFFAGETLTRPEISLLFIALQIMVVLAALVLPKNPLLAGIFEVLVGSVILIFSPIYLLKLCALFIVIGGILAIVSLKKPLEPANFLHPGPTNP